MDSILIKGTDFDINNNQVSFHGIKINNIKNGKRENYRFIKHTLEIDNNKIEANKFHSYEMMARKEELALQGWTKENFRDRLIFSINEQISNHGLNWLLPLFWIIIIGLFYSSFFFSYTFNIDQNISFLGALILSVSSLLFMDNKNEGRYIVSLIPAIGIYLYIQGFNFEYLMRFISIIDFENVINISFTERSLSKLIMGYLIYQFIVAVRKDTRR